jgi:CheY-like chemotaxis protein
MRRKVVPKVRNRYLFASPKERLRVGPWKRKYGLDHHGSGCEPEVKGAWDPESVQVERSSSLQENCAYGIRSDKVYLRSCAGNARYRVKVVPLACREAQRAYALWATKGTQMHNHGTSTEVFRLLYIEDNPSDVGLVREALEKFRFEIALTALDTGDKALAFLNRGNGYSQAQRPHLILLDLNLPGMQGEEVLLTIKADPRLKAIPVVVFTSVASELECKPVYQHNANTCVRKPQNLDAFLETVRQTCEYWFSIANLPKNG